LVKKKEVVEIEDDYFNDDMDADLAQVDLEKFETEADMQFLKVVPKDIVVPTVETVPETVPEKRKLPMGMQTSPPKKLKTEPTLKKEAKPITPKKQATPKVTPKVTPKKITPIKDATKTPTTEETAEAPKAKFKYFPLIIVTFSIRLKKLLIKQMSFVRNLLVHQIV
jgi:hypothetical protein